MSSTNFRGKNTVVLDTATHGAAAVEAGTAKGDDSAVGQASGVGGPGDEIAASEARALPRQESAILTAGHNAASTDGDVAADAAAGFDPTVANTAATDEPPA